MSGLLERLGNLRLQAGAAPETSGVPAGGSEPGPLPSGADTPPAPRPTPLHRGFERLLAVRGTGARPPRKGLSDAELAERLGGQLAGDGLIAVEHLVPLPARHGRWSVGGETATHLCALDLPGAEPLFLDTETTGLAGGTGTTAFLVGLARLTSDALVVRQYLITRFSGEPALLRAVADFSATARTLVSFNGKCFDLPLLATRYRLAGLSAPFLGWPHADLLHPVRRAFGRQWPDCRLGTTEHRLLGFDRPADLPSAEVPAVWLHWLRHRDVGRLPAVLEHNRWDLVSLAALVPALAAAYAAPRTQGANPLSVARHHLTRDGLASARDLLASDRGKLDADGLLELARLDRRQGDLQGAVEIWRELAAQANPRAIEALAKHAEHAERDFEGAHALTERLIALEPENPDHRHRLARLAGRAARGSASRSGPPPGHRRHPPATAGAGGSRASATASPRAIAGT